MFGKEFVQNVLQLCERIVGAVVYIKDMYIPIQYIGYKSVCQFIFGFEIMHDQAWIDIHLLCDLGDRSILHTFSLRHAVQNLNNLFLSDLLCTISNHAIAFFYYSQYNIACVTSMYIYNLLYSP